MRYLLFFASILAGLPNAAQARDDLEKMISMCTLCHGNNGEGLEARSGPKIAGLSSSYLARQLSHFQSGWRGSHEEDIYGQQMVVLTQSWKPEDIDAISAYYAGLHEAKPVSTFDGDPSRGKTLYETCASCHGDQGEGNTDLQAPRLAYQADWAVYQALKTFMSGARGYHEEDDAGQQMRLSVQEALTDQDARDLASYIINLRP